MDGHSSGYPDEAPDRELRSAMNTISYLKNDIDKLKAKLDKTRKLVLDETLIDAEKRKTVLIDIHVEKVGNSMDKLFIRACRGENIISEGK
jgi:hypothetical protein